MLDVVIIGAGPYGLSLASYLRAHNVHFRIFGKPMDAWRIHMPPGMFLKSDGSSLDLPDPQKALTLKHFHAERDESFNPTQVISRETFIAYGLEFQSRMVPLCDNHEVVAVEHHNDHYVVRLSNQEIVHARQIVIAVGVYAFRYLPPVIASLPQEYCTHSAEYGPVDQFKGKKVAIIGAGASAIDLAVALGDHGAEVTIVSRRTQLRFQNPPRKKKRTGIMRLCATIYRAILRPGSGIGSGWLLKIYADAPYIFHAAPAALRRYIIRTSLGPASTWITKDMLKAQKTPVLLGYTPRAAEVVNGKVKLTIESRNGAIDTLEVDHVFGATGYQTDITKLAFLPESIRRKIRTCDGAPELSRCFESSCPGIYFIGPASAMSFGPVMRFVYGAGYTMKKITKRLMRQRYASPTMPLALEPSVTH